MCSSDLGAIPHDQVPVAHVQHHRVEPEEAPVAAAADRVLLEDARVAGDDACTVG